MNPSRLAAHSALRIKLWLLLTVCGFLLFTIAGRGQTGDAHSLASPDGRIQVSILIPPANSADRPRWSASFRGKPIVSDCRLGLQTAAAGDVMAGVHLVRERSRSEDKRIGVLFGKTDHAQDRFHESRFRFEGQQHRRVEVVFRCYDDCVAMRYELPAQTKGSPVVITDETTSFVVEGNPMAYAQYLENYTTSHEHNVTPGHARDLRPGELLDTPLTLVWEDGTSAAITEGALRHYAGMSLRRAAGAAERVELVCQLTPRPDGTKVVGQLPLQTPWRVILIGDRMGALLESSTLYCLNEPSIIKDVSWIKPGKITFSWWNGDVYDGKRDLPILSFGMAKKYIDFCVRTGIPTHSLTSDEKTVSPWYFQSAVGVAPGPDTDVTRLRADFDLATIR